VRLQKPFTHPMLTLTTVNAPVDTAIVAPPRAAKVMTVTPNARTAGFCSGDLSILVRHRLK